MIFVAYNILRWVFTVKKSITSFFYVLIVINNTYGQLTRNISPKTREMMFEQCVCLDPRMKWSTKGTREFGGNLYIIDIVFVLLTAWV